VPKSNTYYYDLSGYEADSEANQEEIIDVDDDIYEGNDLLRARDFCEIARLEDELDNYESEIYYLELAAAIYKSIDSNHPDYQGILHSLGRVYNKVGMFIDADDCYRELR